MQREPPQTRSVQDWSAASQDTLKGCFECADWSVFEDTASSVSELADTVCSYINCVESVIPRKQVKIFSNNKPWVTKPMKDVLFRKRRAFREEDKEQLKSVQKELLKMGHSAAGGRIQEKVRVPL